ncbi:unnamed protein product [Absidia cylindrospora]
MTDTKVAAGGDLDKRHSRRPVWRSLKVVANAGSPSEPPNTDNTINKNKDQPGTPSDQTKSRLSNWLSQQLYEHERQAHYSPSWIGEPETSTMSNLSLVSHVSSVSDSGDGRKRPSSVPNSPTSPTIPRLLMTPVLSNATNTIPLPASSSQPRLLNVMTAKMIPPSSPTTTTLSRTPSISPPPSSAPAAVAALASAATTTTKPRYQNHGMPSSSALPTVRSENACYNGNDEIDSGDDDDENDDTYKTAGGSSDYSEYMEDRLDEINNYSDDSIYYINRYYDDHNSNSNKLIDDTHSKKSTTTVDDDLIDCIKNMDNDLNENFGKNNINEYNDSISEYSNNSDMVDLHDKLIFDSMDPEVAQVLLEWRRQSLLKIDWFDMFATKSDLWRSTTLFHSYLNLEQQEHHTSSCQSSSANTSLDSLQFKGVPLDKAFRSYSNRIDYSKASVSDIDQALQVFAQLYWECNPSKLLQCAELVYIIIHSLMLLNTDVHAGQEHTTIDGFCASTIDLVLDHQASIPIMLFDADGESTWQESMTKCLQSLYKSVEKSSLLPSNQLQQQPWPLTAPAKHSLARHDSGSQPKNEEPNVGSRLDIAFNDMFLSTADTQHNTSMGIAPKKSTSTPPKKPQQRHLRSNSLLSTPSWTLLRRRDTHRTKIGPYKEGPLSCQLNGEAWKICWVILHLGHLHIYHHRLGETNMEHHATNITATLLSSSSSTPLPPDANKSKVKKRFMQHLTPSTAVTNSATNFSGSNNGQMLKNKEPYQQVDIHLGNTFCERHGAHVFLLQLAKGNNTYSFDCGSESQVAIWIRDCNYWAARETKVVLSRELSSSTLWKRPLPPAGASVLDKKGQQEAIDTHLLYLQTELKHHLQQPGWATGPWHDKKMYLELEVRKYQCYHDSIYQQ